LTYLLRAVEPLSQSEVIGLTKWGNTLSLTRVSSLVGILRTMESNPKLSMDSLPDGR